MSEYSNWLEENDYKKAVGQARMQIGALLEHTYSMYGYQLENPMVLEAVMEIVEQFGKRVRGKDVPIQLPGYIRRRIKGQQGGE